MKVTLVTIFACLYFVEEGHVVDAVEPVGDVVRGHEHQRELQQSPDQAVLAGLVVQGGVAAIADPGGKPGGQCGTQREGEPANHNLV